MSSRNTIHINGKVYDAKTGIIIDNKPSSQPHKITITDVAPQKQITNSPAPKTTTVAPKQKIVTTPEPQIARSNSDHRKTHAYHVKPKKSLTINRRIVKAPTLATIAIPEAVKKPSIPTRSTAQVRVNRANNINQSHHISKFHRPQTQQKTSAEISPVPVTAKKNLETKPENINQNKNPKSGVIHSSLAHKIVAESVIQPDEHTKLTKKSKRRHILNNHFSKYASGLAVVLVLGAYVAYLNIPSISMKVAANRAGFSANLPGYTPSGYSLQNPIVHSPGQVAINFKSNTDERKFSLTQQPTNWDSAALLENVVTKNNPNYLTYQDRGLTIYIFDGSSAAWVNDGKMYQVNGEGSSLDADQLLKIATSV